MLDQDLGRFTEWFKENVLEIAESQDPEAVMLPLNKAGLYEDDANSAAILGSSLADNFEATSKVDRMVEEKSEEEQLIEFIIGVDQMDA